MAEVGYYLDGDLDAVRSLIDAAAFPGYVHVEPTDAFTNATIGIYTRTEWLSKQEAERILGVPLIDEEDLEFTDEYAFLKTPQPA